jgi:hypothetical protein
MKIVKTIVRDEIFCFMKAALFSLLRRVELFFRKTSVSRSLTLEDSTLSGDEVWKCFKPWLDMVPGLCFLSCFVHQSTHMTVEGLRVS